MQRVMASGFFILLRLFLRVDGVLVRLIDTRIYHQVCPTIVGIHFFATGCPTSLPGWVRVPIEGILSQRGKDLRAKGASFCD